MSKWYKLTGISTEMFEANKDNFNPELIIWVDGDMVQARIMLNWFEAWMLRRKIRQWNRKHESKFHLLELKEEKIFQSENTEVKAK